MTVMLSGLDKSAEWITCSTKTCSSDFNYCELELDRYKDNPVPVPDYEKRVSKSKYPPTPSTKHSPVGLNHRPPNLSPPRPPS